MRASRYSVLVTVAVGIMIVFGGCNGAADKPAAGTGETSVVSASGTPASLETRVEEWAALSDLVRAGGADKTTAIAGFLWPREDAQERAAEYQKAWSEKAGPNDRVVSEAFDRIVRTALSDDGQDAVVSVAGTILGADGSTTRSLQLVTWTLQEGQWYRTTTFWVPTPSEGGRHDLGVTVRVDAMTWSPTVLVELNSLAPSDGGPRPKGERFLVVTLFLCNGGEVPLTPSDYSLVLYNGDGSRLKTSAAFDAVYPGSAAARSATLDSGGETELSYCFEVPAGIDLAGLSYEIAPLR